MELSVYGAYTNGTDIWLPCENMNALFCQKLTESNGAKYVCSFEGGKIPNAWKIGNVIYFENSLFFFSLYSYEVWILDLQSREMRRVSYYLDQGRFIPDIIRVGNEAWIMPRKFDEPIIIFDLLTWRSEGINCKSYDVLDEHSFTSACVYNGQLFWATRSWGEICICKVDCKNRKMQSWKIPDIDFINCLTVHEEKLYALVLDDRNKALLKKYALPDMLEESSIELREIDLRWKDTNMFYFQMIYYDGKIVILPSLAENIVIYNIDKNEESSISLPKEFVYRSKVSKESFFRKTHLLEDNLYLYPSYGKHLLILNLACMEFKMQEIFCCEEEFWSEYAKRVDAMNGIIGETAHVSVKNYLGYIKLMPQIERANVNMKQGEKIYDITSRSGK